MAKFGALSTRSKVNIVNVCMYVLAHLGLLLREKMALFHEVYHPETNLLYILDFEKIASGCNDLWFGSTSLDKGNTPCTISLKNDDPIHFAQILVLLRKEQWSDDSWSAFTYNDIVKCVEKNSDYYKHNINLFGQTFISNFRFQIQLFITIYCQQIGVY